MSDLSHLFTDAANKARGSGLHAHEGPGYITWERQWHERSIQQLGELRAGIDRALNPEKSRG